MALYITVLNFRTPPWAARFKVPNLLESTYIPFDGALSFASYYLQRLQANKDWRQVYLEDTLIGALKDMPSGFEASYLLPAQMEDSTTLHFWTPYNTRVAVSFDSTGASLVNVDSTTIPQVPLSIKINKRNDLERIFSWRELTDRSLSRDPQRALRGRGDISSGRGPYKNVTLDIQIKNACLLWIAVVEANSKADLEACIQVLEQFGVGKKRYAGWGDLRSFEIYILQSAHKGAITLNCRELSYTMGNRTYLETLRPLSTREASQIIKRGYLPLDIKFMQGASQPPYWRKETVVEKARLLKKSKQ